MVMLPVHERSGRSVAVGDKLALYRKGRWEPVTVVDLAQPGHARVVYDGYLRSSYHLAYHQETVAVGELRSREGLKLYWHYRRVLVWACAVFVICGGGFAGGWIYLQNERVPSAASAPRAWSEGDAVSIEWKGDWYSGVILEVQEDGYLVRYEGYDESWNEVVEGSRLREPSGG